MRSPASATRSRRRSSGRRSRRCSRAATCSGRRRPGRGRRRRSRCRSCSGPRRAAAGRGRLALILVPTRELAMQVAEAVHRYGRELGVAGRCRSTAARRWAASSAPLKRGVDVVVATPGRALDHISRGTLQARAAWPMVVLDEADEMLDMGFAEDLEAILGDTPETGRRRSSRRRCRRGSTASPAATCATRSGSRSAARRPRRGDAPQVRQTAYVVPRGAQAGGARPGARRRGADRGARLLPHARSRWTS